MQFSQNCSAKMRCIAFSIATIVYQTAKTTYNNKLSLYKSLHDLHVHQEKVGHFFPYSVLYQSGQLQVRRLSFWKPYGYWFWKLEVDHHWKHIASSSIDIVACHLPLRKFFFHYYHCWQQWQWRGSIAAGMISVWSGIDSLPSNSYSWVVDTGLHICCCIGLSDGSSFF